MQEPQIVEIPGYGEVEFPSSMTSEQVNAAAAKLYREANPDTRTAGQVSDDGVRNVVSGIGKGVKAATWDAPRAMGEAVGSATPQSVLTTLATGGLNVIAPPMYDAVKHLYDSFYRVGQGAGELLAPGTQPSSIADPSSPEWTSAQESAGTDLGMVAIPAAAKGTQTLMGLNAPKYAERMARYGKRGTGAVGPERVDLERGAMDQVLRTEGTDPISKRIGDTRVYDNLINSNKGLEAVALETPKSTTIPKVYLYKVVDDMVNNLDVANADHASSINTLQGIRRQIDNLSETGNFHEANKLRIRIDQGIAEGKGFTPTVKGDAHALRMEKAAAGSIRDLVGEYAADPVKWRKAAADFSAWRTRADIIENQRPEVLGKRSLGYEAQRAAAAGPIQWGKDMNPNISGVGLSKPVRRVAGSTAEVLQNRVMPTANRAIAKINEGLLGASGKSYGDIVPPAVRTPSTLLQEVRDNMSRGYEPPQPLVRGLSATPGKTNIPTNPEPLGDLLSPKPVPVDPYSSNYRLAERIRQLMDEGR